MTAGEEPVAVPPIEQRGPEVLFVALASGLGGSMRSLATLLGHLSGFRLTVACPQETRFTSLLIERGCADTMVPLPGERTPRLRARLVGAATLAAYASRHRSTLVAVHANGLSERSVALPAAAVARVPLVVWVHEWDVSPWARRLARTLRAVHPCTRFAAVSEDARQTLVRAGIAKHSEVDVIPNPIDPGDVAATVRPDRPSCTVAYLGAPAPYKGFHLLPALIRELLEDPVEWVVFSGPRTAMPEVWAELSALEGDRLRLRDKIPDVREAYAEADIVVCPSLRESFGRVAAEAMANGIPVVASDLPVLRDLVGDGDAGLLVPPGDVGRMAGAVRLLAARPDRRERLGTTGRARVAAYDPAAIARRMASLYRSENLSVVADDVRR